VVASLILAQDQRWRRA